MLVINDSKFERLVLTDLVKRLGYKVQGSSEYDGWECFLSFKPDIVIANLNMNHIQGDELLADMKTKRPEIRCLLSSCSPVDSGFINQRGVDSILYTPVSLEELDRALSSMQNVAAQFSSAEPTMLAVEDIPAHSSGFSYCPYCGQSLEGLSYVFCPYCGEKL